MMKLNILNMKNFLKVVNECRDEVRVILPDGQKKNIRGHYAMQDLLLKEFEKNKGSLKIILEVVNPKDYMSFVSYYAGDC